jgi:ferredoxin
MTWVITRLCRDCLDISCVGVCPVNCIYQYTGTDPKFPNQLYIDPQECIDCGACEPECPWEAIFKDDAVPGVFAEDTELNAWIVGVDRVVPERPPDQKMPTPDEVKANKAKWNYS